MPQIIIPYGAVLAGPKARGKVMGTLLSGLLVGILLSRTVSGIVASLFFLADDLFICFMCSRNSYTSALLENAAFCPAK